MENIQQLISSRRSVRSFDGAFLSSGEKEKLLRFAAEAENPWHIPVEFRLLDAAEQGLSSPVITGEHSYLGGKIRKVPHAEEAFGYSFELLVLYAQSLGLGTTWIGGTMDRKLFEKAMDLQSGEMMPCVSPVGRPAARMSLRESMMRKGVKADSRLGVSDLCFAGRFDTPLTESAAGSLLAPLKAVLAAPSAVNRQPWRLVVADGAVHFYEKHARGYISDATGDLQKVDLGIALCHFALAAEEAGLSPALSLADPGLSAPPETEYIASYLL